MTEEAQEASAMLLATMAMRNPGSVEDFREVFDAGVAEGIRRSQEAVARVPVTQSRQEALAQLALLMHEVTGTLGTVMVRGDET